MQAAEEEKRQREAKKKLLQKERKTLRRILKVRFKSRFKSRRYPGLAHTASWLAPQPAHPSASSAHSPARPHARPPARVQRPLTRMPAHRPLVVSLGTQLPAPGRHGSRECDAGDGARTLRAALRGPGPGGAHGAERVDDQPARDGVEGLHGHRTFAVIVGLGQRERRVAPLTHVCVMI